MKARDRHLLRKGQVVRVRHFPNIETFVIEPESTARIYEPFTIHSCVRVRVTDELAKALEKWYSYSPGFHPPSWSFHAEDIEPMPM